MRGKPKTWAERVKEGEDRMEYYQKRVAKKPLKSPCVKGRLKHTFRSPQTRSLTPELKCWWCGKSREQVEVEQKPCKAREKCARSGFGDFFNCIWAYREKCPQWLQEMCEKEYWKNFKQ